MYDEILYDVKDPVATIQFNRPDRLNAFTYRTLEEFRHALAEAEADDRVVGIVISGSGRGFSAGMDMDSLANTAAGGSGDVAQESRPSLEAAPGDESMGADFQVTWGYLLSIRKPLIAAVNGPCAGLGFVIAMLCDMRFASEKARFTTSFSQRGLVAEHGISWVLPRLIGSSRALDLLWSARKFDADEAERLGVVDRVVAPERLLPEAQGYIENLAENCSPTAIMLMKQQVYRHLMQPLGPAMEESNRLMAESLKRTDFKEGVESFVDKRPPRFGRIGSS
jgi:enoyl-CoA hydratase/carnithine racemase